MRLHIFMVTMSIAALAVTQGAGQIKQGTWEFSASGMAGKLSSSVDLRQGGSALGSQESSTQYATLSLRAGYFAVEGLSIEPELFLDAVEGWNPAYVVSANVAYHHTFEEARLSPFVLAGYGRGNAVPQLLSVPLVVVRFSDGFSIPVWLLGAGGKFHVADHAALRFEYRFQHFSYDRSFGGGVTTSTSMNYSNILLGVSIFVR